MKRGAVAPDERLAAGIAGGLLLAYLLFHVARVAKALGGWGYSIDDAYIHLALARSLSESGVWGLTRFDAAGASSSPLWTLILALFRAPLLLPLLLNIVLATWATAWLAAECARRSGSAILGALLALFAATYALAVFAVSSGMEHVLHGVLSVLFLRACLARGGGWRGAAVVAAWGALALACRLESVIVLGIGGAAALARGDWRRATGAAAGGLLGGGVYLLVAASKGVSPIPNSVAMKVLETPGGGLLGRLWNNLDNQRGLLMTAFILVAAFAAAAAEGVARRRGGESATDSQWEVGVGAAVFLAYLVVAKVSYVGRYEVFALMVAAGMGLPALAGALRGARPGFVAAAAIGGFVLLYSRMATPRMIVSAEGFALRWSRETDSSQREIARFIAEALPRGTVLLNDVGAPSYFTRARILDLWGLGSDPARHERLAARGMPRREWIAEFARRERADAALVFDAWFDGTKSPQGRSPDAGLPGEWTKVGEFHFADPPPKILDSATIGIYATRPEDAATLRAKVAAYRPTSPLNRVVVLGS